MSPECSSGKLPIPQTLSIDQRTRFYRLIVAEHSVLNDVESILQGI